MIRRAWAGAPTSTRVLVVLFGLHVIAKIFLFGQIVHTDRFGDEAYYLDAARSLSNLVRDLASFGPVHVAELQRNLVGSGWFMPGNSILIAPVFVVDPDASITVIRAYIGIVTTLLLLVAVLRVRSTFGDLYAIILVVLPGLIPTWLLFSYGAWGDLVAGLLIVILITEIAQLIRTMRTGQAPSWWSGARFGLIAIAVVYARSSASLLVAALGVVLLIVTLSLLRNRQRTRSVLALGLAGLVFGALLAPWSLFASHTLGGRVLTTTSVPTVMANTFGDKDRLCYGPCDPTSTQWFTPLRYAREVARATGTDELTVLNQMSVYARAHVTAQSYSRDVVDNFHRYAFEPAKFASYLRPADSEGDASAAVALPTDIGWAILLLSAAVTLITVVRRSIDTQVTSILVTLALGSLFTQPFVHIAGSRYWPSAAPSAAIGLGLLVMLLDARRSTPRLRGPWTREPPAVDPDVAVTAEASIAKWLTITQAALAAAVILVFAGIIILARS